MSTPQTSQTPIEPAHNAWFYATKPTRTTLFLRTFLPWQMWRFLLINLKMIGMIRLSHQAQRR